MTSSFANLCVYGCPLEYLNGDSCSFTNLSVFSADGLRNYPFMMIGRIPNILLETLMDTCKPHDQSQQVSCGSKCVRSLFCS